MPTSLHRARIDAVTHELLESGARRVADLGCGGGQLLQRLREHLQFTRLFGIDINERALARARSVLGIDLLRPNKRLQVSLGSFADTDWHFPGVDAAVMLETIEHIEPKHLSRVEKSVFRDLRPPMLLITTPNREYNPLHGLLAGERRDPDHRFEWTRAQFQSWCLGVAERQGYEVRFRGIGPEDPARGCSTQLARFSRAI